MPNLAAQLTDAVPEDYVYVEAAWQIIVARGWPATPELLFALVALGREMEARNNSNLETTGNGRTT